MAEGCCKRGAQEEDPLEHELESRKQEELRGARLKVSTERYRLANGVKTEV